MKYLKTYEEVNNPTEKLVNLLYTDLEIDWLKRKDKDSKYWHEGDFKKIPIQKVKKLLDEGADVNAHDEHNNYGSILNMATKRNDLDLVKFLVQSGADINSYNSCQSTSLYIAAMGNEEIVKFLIESGANMNIPNNSGVLPIHTALFNKHDDIALILLKAGSKLETPQYGLDKWIKNKDYRFQKALCEMYPEEIHKIDPAKLHKKILKDYEYLFAANKYNI